MSQIQVDTIINANGEGAPDFPNGVVVTGVVTATTLNQNVSGILTATSLSLSGDISGVTDIDATGSLSLGGDINAGVITATTFKGDGGSLTGVAAAASGVAGLDIPNGAPVAIAATDGKFYPVTGTNAEKGIPTEWDSDETNQIKVTYDTSNDRVVFVYRDRSSEVGYARVGIVTNTTITFGAESARFQPSVITQYVNAVYCTNTNKVVAVYEKSDKPAACVGTVDPSNNTIAWGTPVEIDSNTSTSYLTAGYDSTTNRIVCVATQAGPKYAWVGEVSGTSTTWGSRVSVPGTAGGPNWNSIICDNGVATYIFNNSIIGGTIDAGTNSITFGTSQTMPWADGNTNIDYTALAIDPDTNKICAVTPKNGTGYFMSARAITRSGTVYTAHPEITLKYNWCTNPAVSYAGQKGKFVAIFGDGNNGVNGTKSVELNIADDNSISKTEIHTISGSSMDSTFEAWGCYDPDEQAAIFGYQNKGDDRDGWYYVEKARISNGTRGGYVGLAQTAYTAGQTAKLSVVGSISTNQTGLATASPYYLKGDGTFGTVAGTGDFLIGNALSATDLLLR